MISSVYTLVIVNTNPNIIASKEHFLPDAFSQWMVDHMSTMERHHHHDVGAPVRTAEHPWHANAPWHANTNAARDA